MKVKTCCKCKKPISTGYFVGRNLIYCRPCYLKHERDLEDAAGKLEQRIGDETL